MFPDLSRINTLPAELILQTHVKHVKLRAEARELVTVIGGPGYWPERRRQEEVIYDVLNWIEDDIQW